MIATGHPIAAQTALDVLDRGGSAIDAAIAADAILGVVEPMATGIGGDLLAMIVEPGGEAVTYNGTGRAPLALDAAMVEALPDRRIPDRHPLSVTTPGVVRGWYDLHARYGRIDIAELLAPAIRLAAEGFAVGPIAAREWKFFDCADRQGRGLRRPLSRRQHAAGGRDVHQSRARGDAPRHRRGRPRGLLRGRAGQGRGAGERGLRRRPRGARLRRPPRQFRQAALDDSSAA